MQNFLQRFTFRSIILGVVLGLIIVGLGYDYLYNKNQQAIKFNELHD